MDSSPSLLELRNTWDLNRRPQIVVEEFWAYFPRNHLPPLQKRKKQPRHGEVEAAAEAAACASNELTGQGFLKQEPLLT
jgi:hypothetical protein